MASLWSCAAGAASSVGEGAAPPGLGPVGVGHAARLPSRSFAWDTWVIVMRAPNTTSVANTATNRRLRRGRCLDLFMP